MTRPLPVLDGPDGVIAIGADPTSDPRVRRRDQDRRIALGGIVLSLAFIAAAIGVCIGGGDTWTALHLLMAGAAGTAIGAVMPFFATALVAAPPAEPRGRVIVVACLALGAAAVATAAPGADRAASLLGAGVYLLGLVGLALVTLGPIRRGVGRRRHVVVAGYGVAIAFVMTGVLLVTGMLHDFAPIASRWPMLKPAHAWLNLIGFVGVVIATTMTHLVPTVLGARIIEGRIALTALLGLAAGVATVASGFALGVDGLVRVGATMAFVGALAVPVTVLAAATQAGRGRWTTDQGWHTFTAWSLSASAVWFVIGVSLAAALAIANGATPAGWSLSTVGVPFVIGCVLQAILGSASHLLPTLGPGSQADRSAARLALGRMAKSRALSFQLGVAVLMVALQLGEGNGIALGAALVVAPVAATHGFAVAALVGWRARRR